MFFDSVDMLAANFFSREVLFVVGLSFVFFETNRMTIIILNRIYPIGRSIRFRIILQYALSFIFTLSIISLCLFLYFTHIEGFSTIHTELLTFNSIFLFAGVFYHLYFFSLNILYKKNEHRVQKEIIKKDNLQYELNNFKNQVNPEFLFQSLEVIIAELYRNKKQADELIGKLAITYRYTLDNKNLELVPLSNEIDSLMQILPIYKLIYFDAIQLSLPNNFSASYHIIPGTLHTLLEQSILKSIITEALPLKINISTENNVLIMGFNHHEKISDNQHAQSRFEMLKQAYSYYSDKGIQTKTNDGVYAFKVPLLEIEEE